MTGTAIIIGGGVGGLCTAIALRQIGIEAVVYERAGLPGDVGAGLVVAANAIRSLRRLVPADKAIAAGSKVMRAQIRTSDGRPLAKTDMSDFEHLFGAPTIAIHRAALPKSTVKLGASCVSVDEDAGGVTAISPMEAKRGQIFLTNKNSFPSCWFAWAWCYSAGSHQPRFHKR